MKPTPAVIAAASALLCSCASASAADPASLMTAKTFTSSEGLALPYRIYVPAASDATGKVPAVLFLHGAGERGTNNVAQMLHCIPQMMRYVVEGGHPAVVVVPQCPTGMQWVDAPWGALSHVMSEKPSKPMQAVIEMFETEIAAAPVDRSRLYVSGISMGGYGTWDVLQRFPEKFAAGMPICGGGDTNLAARLVNIPIHVVHGEKDSAVPVTRSRSMVEAIKTAGGRKITYLERAGEGHGVWTPTYNDVANLDWLFSHALRGCNGQDK